MGGLRMGSMGLGKGWGHGGHGADVQMGMGTHGGWLR